MVRSLLEVERTAGRVTEPHDDNFGRGHAVIDQIGVGMREEAANIRTSGPVPGVRMLLKQGNKVHEVITDPGSSLR
jgi:hypothetical protein